jgi:dihydroflavonol-4-reductase
MIAVTGATGHLGNALLRALLERRRVAPAGGPAQPAESVRALVRPGRDISCLAGLDVEIVSGHLHDLDSLVAAFRGADAVFHLAGKVSITGEKYEDLRHVNVVGTRNVIAACRTAGVGRLVHTSSIHAFVEPPLGTCIDEATPIDLARIVGAYGKSKAEATQLVFQAASEGLDAVVVFPTGIIGPYDFRPSDTGQMIIDFGRGKIPASTDGRYNFVDVRDVAEGLISARDRGCSGEGYLLSGRVLSVSEMFALLEELTGRRAPRLHVSIDVLRAIAPVIPAYYWVTRQRPLFTRYSLAVLCANCEISSAKAEGQFGYAVRPLRETFGDTVTWFKEHGML